MNELVFANICFTYVLDAFVLRLDEIVVAKFASFPKAAASSLSVFNNKGAALITAATALLTYTLVA